MVELVGLFGLQTVRDEFQSAGQFLSFLAQEDLIPTVPEAAKLAWPNEQTSKL